MKFMKTIKGIDFRFISSVIVAWTLLLMFISKDLSGDDLIYAIGEIQTYNHSLLDGNVYMGEGVISPRYILDAIFNVIMHANGGDWAGAALVLVYFGAIIQSLGIANIARRINRNYQIAISAIFTCLIAYCDNYLAGFSLIALTSTSIGVALAFSILSISFLIGDHRNYLVAWIFAACAIVCHIHEGIYCCAVIFLFAAVDCIIQKKILFKENKSIIIAAIALLAVVLPNMLTDHMDISNSEFVYIFSNFRTPHHLVPSAWGIDSIYKPIWIDICLLLLCMAERKNAKSIRIKQYLYEAIALVSAWIVAMLLMYIFTEIKPLAFVSTLYLSKSFKYVLLIALIWIVNSSLELRNRGNYLSSYLFIYISFLASTYELKQVFTMSTFVFLLMQVEDYLRDQNKILISGKSLPFIDVLFFILMVCIKRETLGIDIGFLIKPIISKGSYIGQGFVVVLVFFAVAAISYAMKRKFRGYKGLCVMACVCMIMLSFWGRIIVYDNGSISLISGEKALKASFGDDLFTLAESFREATDPTTEFLANPDDTINAGWFQVVSQRNCYVLYKVIPSSKSTVDDWYDRYMQTNSFDDKSGTDIEEIMNSSDLDYVLINADNYAKLEETGDFSVFMISPADTFRVYKLNEKGEGDLCR